MTAGQSAIVSQRQVVLAIDTVELTVMVAGAGIRAESVAESGEIEGIAVRRTAHLNVAGASGHWTHALVIGRVAQVDGIEAAQIEAQCVITFGLQPATAKGLG